MTRIFTVSCQPQSPNIHGVWIWLEGDNIDSKIQKSLPPSLWSGVGEGVGVTLKGMNLSKFFPLTLEAPETKIADFANSVDTDEVAHDEPPL